MAKPKKRRDEVFLNIPYESKFEKLFVAYIAGLSAFGLVPRDAGDPRQFATAGKDSRAGEKVQILNPRSIPGAVGSQEAARATIQYAFRAWAVRGVRESE